MALPMFADDCSGIFVDKYLVVLSVNRKMEVVISSKHYQISVYEVMSPLCISLIERCLNEEVYTGIKPCKEGLRCSNHRSSLNMFGKG